MKTRSINDLIPRFIRHITFAILLICTVSLTSYSYAEPLAISRQQETHTLTIDSTTVRPDTTFQLVIQTSDLTGAAISSFDITLSYDANLLTPTGATLDGTISGSGGAGLTLVSNLSTPGTIALAAAGATTLSGSGSLVILTFESLSDAGTSAITFEHISLNEGDPSASGVAGAVTIEPLVIGDASLNNEISAYDASMVLQHSAGISTLSGDAYTAAEASGNGAISAYDAALILQYSAGLLACFPADAGCSASKHTTQANAHIQWAAPTSSAATLPLLIHDIEGTVNAITLDIPASTDEALTITSHLPKDWVVTSGQLNDQTYRIVLAGTSALAQDTLLTLGNSTSLLPTATYQVNESPFTSLTQQQIDETPSTFALHQNYPNPFNPSTTIQYMLPEDAELTLTVYDMLGREVALLVDGAQKAGTHTLRFDASHLASGTYLYRIETAQFTTTRQMILVK